MATAKTKWIELNADLGMRAIAARLSKAPFTLHNSLGFELLEARGKRLEARYIERFVQHESVVDPFGHVQQVETVRYTIFRFYLLVLEEGRYVMVLINAPRSVRSFVDAFSSVLNAGMSVAVSRFDVLSLMHIIRSAPGIGNLTVRKIKASGPILDGQASVRLELQSRGNASDDLRKAFPKLNAVVERVCFQFFHDGAVESGELSSSGVLAISEHLVDLFVDLMAPTITSAQR
ncbi:hypothetical protein [Achromobacter animicus]|uniref:hypothetical protein n=1 Tax=Achromobacter animicus TaxID=1389935 RepID=UPI00345E507A